MFTRLNARGYDCHILWDTHWNEFLSFYDCFRDDATVHSFDWIRQPVGCHYQHEGFLQPDKEKEEKTFSALEREIRSILEGKDNIFLWIHFPHVINGRVCYGSDIDLFDRYVGLIRELVGDGNIAITADHGNMNGHKGKICYGFDVYEPAACVPLITPRIEGSETVDFPTSHIDLYSILFDKVLPRREYIFCDCAYRAQKSRKLAIMHENYKYIYIKATGQEELYDLAWDKGEEFNLIDDYMIDIDRKVNTPCRELYFYTDWEKADKMRGYFREIKASMWKNGTVKATVKNRIRNILSPLYHKLKRKKITTDM